MGAREVTSKESGAAQRRIFFLLILYVHLVTSQLSGNEAAEAEAEPCPPQLPYSSLNSCPDHLITEILDALTSTTPPPPHEGGDLSPVADMMSDPEPIRTATFAQVVVTALSASRKEEGWEIMFKLLFPAAVCALLFCEIPLRNLCPRFAHIIEKLLLILSVNALTALLLPAELLWVPALCFAASLLTLFINAP